MYHTDSPPRLVTASPYEPLSGTIGAPEPFWQGEEARRLP